MTRSDQPPGASLEELRAEAEYAGQRLALYRRKILLGQGDPRRLSELERISTGAAARLKRAHPAGGTLDARPPAPSRGRETP